jgi:hypothetical protein
VASDADTDGNASDNHVTLPSGAITNVTYSIQVCAGIGVDLANVTLTDAVLTGLGCTMPAPFSLPKGACTNITLCTVEISCASLPNPNTVQVTANIDTSSGVCDRDASGERITATSECSGSIECAPGYCVTRTPGYWFTHWKNSGTNCVTLEKAIIMNGGQLNLGYITLTGTTDEVLSKALGYFWSKRNLYGDGTRAGNLCKARKKLSWHLIAAIANTVVLGTDPSGCTYMNSTGEIKSFPADLIAQAQAAAAGCDIAKINQMQSLVDAFNNSGDSGEFPEGLYPCSADPRGARGAAVDITTPANCQLAGCP